MRSISNFIRDLRIRHHDRAANAHGAAMLAAQACRDFKLAARHWERMTAHREKRDTLAIRRGPAARADIRSSREVARICTQPEPHTWCVRPRTDGDFDIVVLR